MIVLFLLEFLGSTPSIESKSPGLIGSIFVSPVLKEMCLQFVAAGLLGLPGAIAALLTPGAPVAGGTPAHRVSYPHTLQSQHVRQL